VIGYGCVWNTLAPGKYRLDLFVHPDWRRRGFGSRLFERLMVELQALAGVSLQARAREDETGALAFLEHQAFVEVHRMVYVRLDVAEANPALFQPVVERVLASGITISTLAEEQARDPHCWIKLHALHDAARLGWADPDPDPDAGPAAPQPYQEFEQMLRGLNPIPEAFSIAHAQGRYLGYSGLAPNPEDPRCLYSANTAVRPEARGNGIATALKVRTVEYAKRHGYSAIQTSSANPAMIAINEKLGFQPLWSEVRLVKRL
jgi:GNAT superfamily N-acetyltransferase